MDHILSLYQNIPLYLSPTAFRLGFFQIGWYPISYVVGFLVVYILMMYRMRREEDSAQIFNFKFLILKQLSNSKCQNSKKIQNTKYQILDTFFIYAIIGVLVGGRLGYVLFYNLPYYLSRPLEIISPYDFVSQTWVGIYGMSYHGGLIGVILAAFFFCRKNKIYPVKSSAKAEIAEGKFNRVNFWKLSDFIIPAVPAGYFFGRIGNFLNGELYGRITNSAWGMYFFDGKQILLRYPSQLIEALLEGIIIFIILWPLRNKSIAKGKLLFLYIMLYGIARFLAEFFREPDEQIGFLAGFLTLGQIFSSAMVFIGLLALIFRKPPHQRAYARDIGG